MLPLILLAGILFLGAVLLLVLARKSRQASGLPSGRVVYSDTSLWQRVETPLFDPHTGLAGRPDYLVQQQGELIPVEVKSTATPERPYDSHIYQLAAYCRLVEATYGTRPSQGLLHYPGRTFALDYTAGLEASLLELLEEMRRCDSDKSASRSHDTPARCASCGYRSICDQKLD
jgi:CRISPR-associated exonuclease Cas4